MDPTNQPTSGPTTNPTQVPTKGPTPAPSDDPTDEPTHVPSNNPTRVPTQDPTMKPTHGIVYITRTWKDNDDGNYHIDTNIDNYTDSTTYDRGWLLFNGHDSGKVYTDVVYN